MILHIESSARPRAECASRRLAGDLVARLRRPHDSVAVRYLAAVPLPHVDAAFVKAIAVPEAERTPRERARLSLSETLIGEVEAAGMIVIGAPMYNYAIPSALKAWIDHIVRARRTFRHTPDGPVGLLADRPVYLVTAAGGRYAEGPGAAMDFCVPYLRAVLGKVGLSDLRVLRMEGLALDPDAALAQAMRDLDALVPDITAVDAAA